MIVALARRSPCASDDGRPAGRRADVRAGTFLDLQLEYLEGGVLTRLAAPAAGRPGGDRALHAPRHRLHYPRPPLPLSRIACDIVRLAEDAPELRRGRP